MASPTKGDRFLIRVEEANELIIADGAIRETHADASLFTQFPVGRGAVISDHKQDAPSLIAVDLLITDTPVDTPESNIPSSFSIGSKVVSVKGGGPSALLSGDLLGAINEIAAGSDINTKAPSEFLERGKAVYQRLLDVAKAGLLLTVSSSHRTYENMVLTRIELPVDTAERITIIGCEFQQILFADSQEVEILVVNQPRNKSEKDKGSQEATLEDNASATQAKSLLSAVSGLF